MYGVDLPHPYPILIAGVGHPKDSNLYQVSRAARLPDLDSATGGGQGRGDYHPGPMPEGIGEGLSEQRFSN